MTNLDSRRMPGTKDFLKTRQYFLASFVFLCRATENARKEKPNVKTHAQTLAEDTLTMPKTRTPFYSENALHSAVCYAYK